MPVSADIAIDYLLQWEGGLEEDERDPGGITNRGISLRFLKSLPPETLAKYGFDPATVGAEEIRNLTLKKTKEIYLGEFWDKMPFGRINSQNIVNYVLDSVVNMGPANAIKCAQRACWSVMKSMDAPVEDGQLGNATIEMINHCAFYFLPAMRSERAGYYRLLAFKTGVEDYLSGWLRRAYQSGVK